MIGQRGSRLPAGYIELEYIECDGRQYAKLATGSSNGLEFNLGWDIYAKYLASSGSPYGWYYSSWNRKSATGANVGSGSIVIYYGMVYGRANPYDSWIPNVTINDASSSSWHTIKQTVDGVIFDDGALTAYSLNGGNYSYRQTVYGDYLGVCGRYNETSGVGGMDSLFSGYLAELKVGQGTGDVFYHLIPAMNAILEVGFYDLINDNFITSESGTAFIAGPVK